MITSKRKVINTICTIILGLLAILIGGFTNMYLWNNIVSELFEIRTLDFIQAMAVDLVLTYFFYQYKQDERTNRERYLDSLSITITFLAVGYILTFFI